MTLSLVSDTLPTTIRVFASPSVLLAPDEVKYYLRLLFKTAGLPVTFVTAAKHADVVYGPTAGDRTRLHIIARESAVTGVPRITKSFACLQFPGDLEPSLVVRGSCTILSADIVFATAYAISGGNELSMTQSKYGDFHVEESYLYPKDGFFRPIVNVYVQLLRQVFKQNNPLPIWPNGKRFAVALTHDVDYPELIPWIESLRYIFQKRTAARLTTIRSILRGRESFWLFDQYVALEKKYGARSAFYFCARDGGLIGHIVGAPDPFYDVSSLSFRNLFKSLRAADCEIGLHASFNAYASEKVFRSERNKLARAAGVPVFGNRHHYWHTAKRFIDTCKIHERVGFTYDCSLAFERHPGFRRSIGTPFYLYDSAEKRELAVLELPTALMDDQLFSYRHKTGIRTWQALLKKTIASARDHNCLLVVDYHDRVLNETFFPQWGASYELLLKLITQDNDAYIATPQEIAQYWQNRDTQLDAIARRSK